MRADPFPAARYDGGPRTFEFGDHPGAVVYLMRQLLALALDPEPADFATRWFVFDTLIDHPGMALHPALTAPRNELRLPWPTIRALAAADIALVRRLLAVGEPPLHHYFAILADDKLHQVVRLTGTPEGQATEEHVAPDGGWTQSFLLTEIRIGKSDKDYRRLSPDEIDTHLRVIRARRPR
ncbi:hypothetical protein M1L60_19910 [Actinoplanes sp. TRM 88003]|uniref:Uncharacterized protein n=1 Tax=Paractinoplanes aksuensis TaxID=2939490 RepID=A0ABT1DPU3_9ACTN|nr:hypothetical protein [Actinoplanes aksuensis]MCO8272864.1 hypothetical protein [Actinoplanes aksuensis]